MVTKIFQLLLFLSPICIGADIDMDMFDITFFRTGIIVLFIGSLIDKSKRIMPDYVNKIIFSLLGICMANLFIHNFALMVLHTQMNLFLGIVGFYIVYQYWDEKQSIRKCILWAGTLNLAFFISQKLGFNPIFDKMPYIGQEGAFLGNQPRLMTYFALLTPFLPLWGLLGAFLLGLYTRQIIIFAPITIILFMKAKSKREKIGIGIITLLAMIVLKDKILQALSFRFNMSYKPVLTAFFDRPLIGFGLGIRPIPELEVIGNSYFQFIVGIGLLGAVWYGYVFKNLYKKLSNNIESIALISLGVIMLVEYPLELTRLWYLIMAIIIMFLIKSEVECGVHD